MDSILLSISEGDGVNFQAFLDAQTTLDQYSPAWQRETELEYTDAKSFNEMRNANAELVMGSVIEKNADKPVRDLPNFGSIVGSLGRMGDRWQMDNDKLERYYALETRLRKQGINALNETSRIASLKPIARTLFDVGFKTAAFAPHVRLDHLWFQGYTAGIISITPENNPYGVSYEFETGINKETLPASAAAVWGGPDAKPLLDIRNKVASLLARGKRVTSIEMNTVTFNKMVESGQIINTFTVNIGTAGNVRGGELIGVDVINRHLQINGLPPITLKDNFTTALGALVNSFEDDRVVYITNNVTKGKILHTDPLEVKDPHPNKVYGRYLENLLSQYRTEEGRFIEYEMWALPVFTGEKDIYTVDVSQKAVAGDAPQALMSRTADTSEVEISESTEDKGAAKDADKTSAKTASKSADKDAGTAAKS